MKIKVSEATGVQLDWLVAKIEGLIQAPIQGKGTVRVKQGLWKKTPRGGLEPHILRNDFEHWVKACEDYPFFADTQIWCPTTDWAQGGPIIHREKVTLEWTGSDWCAYIWHDKEEFGPTPLIAAMRCFVTIKLGDEVEVPDELA